MAAARSCAAPWLAGKYSLRAPCGVLRLINLPVPSIPPPACHCGHSLRYADCCGALHSAYAAGQGLTAATPEALMRSRYCAFVLDLRDYLLATWHPSTRPAALERPEPGLKWLGLDVRRADMQDADHGTVEFVARSKLGGRAHRLHEVSRFVRQGGAWFYVDGDLKN